MLNCILNIEGLLFRILDYIRGTGQVCYSHSILTKCFTFSNSGSPVRIDAENLRAVATAKQSAYDMAYSALISEADSIISEEGEITWRGNS